MRAATERALRRWWAGELGAAGRVLALAAAPLSWGWSRATTWALDRRAVRATRVEGLAVISVGNLAVGGTGKTPLASWIAARLQELGARPAILVGGHGRDEARLHERRLLGVPVFQGRDRVAGARGALTEGARVAVLDDGFQHVGLARDMDAVLLAAEDPFPGRVLPAGPYREGPGALERADAVLITRRSASREESRRLAERVEERWPGLVVGGVHLAVGGWTRLDGAPAGAPRGAVVALSGIARPAGFQAVVARQIAGPVEPVAFRDHHHYTPADVSRLRRRARGRTIVTTEKDAVKLHPYEATLGEAFVLTEEVRWDWGEDALLDRLRALAVPSRAG